MGSPSKMWAPPWWMYDPITSEFMHHKTFVRITEEMAQDHGFPPEDMCKNANAIRQWYFNKVTAAKITGQTSPHYHFKFRKAQRVQSQKPNFNTPLEEARYDLLEAIRIMAPDHEINRLKTEVFRLETMQRMNQARTAAAMNAMRQQTQSYMNQYMGQWDPEPEPTELLLCVASYTDRIPASLTYTVSLEWLRCRTSKDSVWHSCSLVKSPQLIKLWEKDFILTQTILPGSDPINEVAIGCRLNSQGRSRLDGAFQVVLGVSEDAVAPFFNISEMQ